MLEKITDWLIERRLKKQQITIHPFASVEAQAFRRVLNTLRRNKVVVITKDDGIYIRLGGTESDGEAYSEEFAKVLSIESQKK